MKRQPTEWEKISADNMTNKGLVVKSLSRIRLFATPWTVAYQAPQSMEFSRQEYWSGLPFPSPGDIPEPGIEPRSPTFQADTLTSEPPGKPDNSKSILIKVWSKLDLFNFSLVIPEHCHSFFIFESEVKMFYITR